jgi:caffeoyl-CoA O-methyltransferase
MPKSFLLDERLHDYVVAHSEPLDDVQRWLIERTAELGPVAGMQIAPEQGAFFTLLARLVAPHVAVEVGTFTGYSSLCLARGLPDGGRLLCCDINEEWTAIAREAWTRAGVADRIELRLAPALDTLRSLPDEPHIDLSFVDADKGSYLAYYEELVRRTRPGGLLAVDNVLWRGAVADPDDTEPDTQALRAFNDRVAADERVTAVMLPIADGLTLLQRRA